MTVGFDQSANCIIIIIIRDYEEFGPIDFP